MNAQITVQNMDFTPELDNRETQEYREFTDLFCKEVTASKPANKMAYDSNEYSDQQ